MEASNTDMPDHESSCDRLRKMCEKTKTENEIGKNTTWIKRI